MLHYHFAILISCLSSALSVQKISLLNPSPGTSVTRVKYHISGNYYLRVQI